MSTPSSTDSTPAHYLSNPKDVGTKSGNASEALTRLAELQLAVTRLSVNEQKEFDFVTERLNFFMARHQASAALAIVAMSLRIAAAEGQ